MAVTSISRRIEKAIEAFGNRDYEDAFVQLFPAVDKTGKKRRPKAGVGERIKGFISDEEAIISVVATGSLITNITVNGIDFPTALYKFGRTSIVHEGELDERLKINEEGSLQIGDVWNLPASYIIGIIVSVVTAPENANEKISDNIEIRLFGQSYRANELWGKAEIIQKKICEIFKDESLFNKNA